MNLVQVPMWILSGVFFSAQRFPDAVQPFIQRAAADRADRRAARAHAAGRRPRPARPGARRTSTAWLVVCFAARAEAVSLEVGVKNYGFGIRSVALIIVLPLAA